MVEEKVLSVRDRELLKKQWLMIYLPMILGLLLVIAFITVLAVPGFKSQNLGGAPLSNWGDASAILVIVQFALASLVPLALLVALCALFFYLYIKIQPVLKQGQKYASLANEKTDQAAYRLISVFFKPYAFSARVRTFLKFLRRSNV